MRKFLKKVGNIVAWPFKRCFGGGEVKQDSVRGKLPNDFLCEQDPLLGEIVENPLFNGDNNTLLTDEEDPFAEKKTINPLYDKANDSGYEVLNTEEDRKSVSSDTASTTSSTLYGFPEGRRGACATRNGVAWGEIKADVLNNILLGINAHGDSEPQENNKRGSRILSIAIPTMVMGLEVAKGAPANYMKRFEDFVGGDDFENYLNDIKNGKYDKTEGARSRTYSISSKDNNSSEECLGFDEEEKFTFQENKEEINGITKSDHDAFVKCCDDYIQSADFMDHVKKLFILKASSSFTPVTNGETVVSVGANNELVSETSF